MRHLESKKKWLHLHGATQKFGEFKQGAQTGCRYALPPLMWQYAL